MELPSLYTWIAELEGDLVSLGTKLQDALDDREVAQQEVFRLRYKISKLECKLAGASTSHAPPIAVPSHIRERLAKAEESLRRSPARVLEIEETHSAFSP